MADLNTLGGLHYEMMKRCYNENSIMYSSYGAKGIKVCEEWHDRENFKKWARENGYEKGLRLDRVDPLRDYTPENCIWGLKNTKPSVNVYMDSKRRATEIKQRREDLGVSTIRKHPLYSTFSAMHNRCEVKTFQAYKYYGAKGIKVCDEWSGKDGFYNFFKWAESTGADYLNLTIDRIDIKKDYCPENCRWATMQEQALNRSNTRVIEYRGQKYSISGLCKQLNIDKKKFVSYLDKGLMTEVAIAASEKQGKRKKYPVPPCQPI